MSREAELIAQAGREEVQIRRRLAALEEPRDSAETLKELNALACVLSTQAKYDEAIELFKRVIDSRTEQLGGSHADVLLSKRNLGLTLEKAERLGEAEQVLIEVFGKQKEILGNTNRETLGTQRCLAMLLKRMRRPEEAERMLLKCLDLNESTYGMDHTTTTVVNDLAMVFKDQGKTQQAKELLEKAVRVKERSLGANHPSTRSSVFNLIKVLQEIDEHREAVRYGTQLRRHLASAGAIHRGELLDVLRTMRNSLQKLGDEAEVRSHLHEVLSELLILSRIMRGNDHAITGLLIRDLAAALKASGKGVKALPYYKEFYLLKRDKIEPSLDDKKVMLTALNNLATCYKALGRLDDAVPLFRQTLEGRIALLGPADQEVGLSYNNLAMALYQLPSPPPPTLSPTTIFNPPTPASLHPWEEAVNLLVTANETLTGSVGDDHSDTRNCRGNLAIVRARIAARLDSPQGINVEQLRASKEEIALQKAFFVERLGPNHAWTAKFQSELDFVTSLLSITGQN